MTDEAKGSTTAIQLRPADTIWARRSCRRQRGKEKRCSTVYLWNALPCWGPAHDAC